MILHTWTLYICTKGSVSEDDHGASTTSDSAGMALFAERDDNESHSDVIRNSQEGTVR